MLNSPSQGGLLMIRSLICLLMVIQSLSASVLEPESRLIIGLKTGTLLRMHVVAQDDSEEMQRIKLCVRDAVRSAYDQHCPDPAAAMQLNTLELLPLLTQTAEETARSAGFNGPVLVTLETTYFDQRTLGDYTLPAGDYPALMIRLGDAQGQNWWGLIDPALALETAAIALDNSKIAWDWSLQGFLQALWGRVSNDA